MSDIDAFKAELRAAGQPWSRRGAWAAGAGILVLLYAQISPIVPYPVVVIGLALALIAAGWTFLVIAYFKRRRWSKDNPVETLQLADLPMTDQAGPTASGGSV